MKTLQKRLNKVTAMLLSLVLLITSMPTVTLSVFAEDGDSTKYDNPWDYTVFGNSIEFPMSFASGSSVSINGDAHANNSFKNASKTFKAGTVEAGEEVNTNNAFTTTEGIVENAPKIKLPQIYYSIQSLEGGKARKEIAEDTPAEELIRTSIISDEDINIDLTGSSLNDMHRYTKKAGAFGAAFLTEVYENPDKWNDILPVLDRKTRISTDSNGKVSLIELSDNSFFAATQDTSVDSGKYSEWDNLPSSVFMDNLNGDYVSGYLDALKNDNDVFSACKSGAVEISASGNNSTATPDEIADTEKIIVNGGNLTLNGDYDSIREFKVSSYGNIQLLGNYKNLEYIYVDGWGNLNLAGNFPSLKGVYMPGGTLLLGTDSLGFNAVGADIINENQDITIYTAKDTSLNYCNVVTNGKIAIRGKADGETSTFTADSAMFAAGNTLVIGDMNDINTDTWYDVPCFVSQSGIAIINSNFKRLQGAFLSRNDRMVIAGSKIDIFSGFLYAQNGINGEKTSANEGVNVQTSDYNIQPGIASGQYTPSADEVGGIKNIEYSQMPSKLNEVPGVEELLKQVLQIKDSDGKYVDRYEHGLRADEENIIYIMSKGDITITADDFNTPKGRRMIIASRNGDITISASPTLGEVGYYVSSNFDGILYAPKGKVEYVSGQGLNLKGRVYADNSYMSGYWVNITLTKVICMN